MELSMEVLGGKERLKNLVAEVVLVEVCFVCIFTCLFLS